VPDPAGSPLPVVTSVAEALARVAGGERVVVVVAPAEAAEAAGLLALAGGQAPFLVGEPGDPVALAAAARGAPGGGG
jgi:hypothetical protein